MKHFLLMSERHLYPSLVLKTKLDQVSWVDGEELANPPSRLQFTVKGSDPLTWCDFLMPAADIPLFSPTLRRALEAAGVDNVEYFPATVTHPKTKQKREYWAANVLGMVAGMDRKRSKYTGFRGSDDLAGEIEKLVLDDEAFEKLGICRLSEYDLLIVVSEKVKRAAAAAGVEGVVFMSPRDWDGFAT